MDTFSRIDSCRICGNRELAPILSLGEQCLTGVFPRTLAEQVTKGPLELVKCSGGKETCGLVQLQHSYSPDEMYGQNYGYRSSLNRSMVNHLERKVAELQQVVPLSPGDLVLDIGSNDGTTLSFYPDSANRVGMDPTARKFREHYAPGIHVIEDFFSSSAFDSKFGGKKAKIVTSIAMLYDLAKPVEFAREVASVLDDDGIWHFEQSYLPLMLSTNAYDTICHEHVEYYDLSQIAWIMRDAGLTIIDVATNDINGGSFAVTVAKHGSARMRDTMKVDAMLEAERDIELDTLKPFIAFAEQVAQHRESLPGLLHRLRKEGSLVVGYGASTKGNVILQYCGIGPETIPCMAEVNTEKFGAFTPGSGIPIVSEAEARAMKPDFFLAMPWHFRRNLLEREEAFVAGGGQMIFPLPQIEIVGTGGN